MWHEGSKVKKLSKVHYMNEALKFEPFFPALVTRDRQGKDSNLSMVQDVVHSLIKL